MQSIHMPLVGRRYWLGITLASVFGTNLGDFYAHESGLGIGLGLLVLAVLAALVFLVERSSRRAGDLYYWLVIIIIRTGATNIADFLAFRVRVPGLILSVGLAAIIAFFAWRQHRLRAQSAGDADRLASTGVDYWSAMLAAGVFGTVVGDICQHLAGQDPAAIGLSALLAAVFALRGFGIGSIASYWATVAVARTTGTALGDWLAENRLLGLGLPVATAISGVAFVLVLLVWRHRTDGANDIVASPRSPEIRK